VQTLRLLALRVAQRLAARLASRETAARLVRLGHAVALRVKLARRLAVLAGQPVTIYAQDSISSATAGRLRRSTGLRLVTVVHFNRSEAEELAAKKLTQPGGKLFRATQMLERRSMAAADRILFVSDYVRQQVLSRYDREVASRSSLLSLAPEADITRAFNLPSRNLIAIGTLEARKNQAFLLDVLHACATRGHRYTLTLVGDGPDHAMLESRAAALGLSDLVTFSGRVADGHRRIADHQALVHGARDEALGLNPDDAADSAEQVIALLEDAPRLAAMGVAARSRFDAQFSKAVAATALRAELGL
jgi:glycosyltransferase involved in cell wall biosynthesis